MRNTLKIPDPIVMSSPNGGGLAVLDRELFLPLMQADITGVAIGRDFAAWCLQSNGSNTIRELRDGQFRTVQISDAPLDLHDLMVDGDDIYAVSTETNEVLRCDHEYRVIERIGLGGAPDSCHLNCIAMHEGRLLASIFGRFTETRGYKGLTRGAGQVIDVRTGEVLIDGLSQPHSLVSVGKTLYLCSSQDKTLVVYEGFKPVRKVALPGYTRGLAVGAEHIYVGLSCSRNLETQGDVGRFETGAIAVLRRGDLECLGMVPVPWKEVYDIRIVEDVYLMRSLIAAAWEQERAAVEQERAAVEQEQASLQETAAAAAAVAAAVATARISSLEKQHDVLKQRNSRRDMQVQRLRVSHAGLAKLVARRQRELDMQVEQAALRDGRIGELQQKLSDTHVVNRRLADRIGQVVELIALRDGRIGELSRRVRVLQEEAGTAQSLTQATQSELKATQSKARDLAIKVARLEPMAEELETLKASRSWRLTRPLRFAMRLVRNRGLAGSDRDRIVAKVGRMSPFASASSEADSGLPGIAPMTVESGDQAVSKPRHDVAAAQQAGKHQAGKQVRKAATDVHLVPRQDGLDDVFFWAVIDWHFRIQRPQHMARELARTGRRVFYISNNLVDSDEPGFRVEPLDDSGRLFQVFLHVAGKPTIYFDPPTPQADRQLRDSLAILLRWTKSMRTLSLVQHPFWAHVARALPNHRLVYDCMDHHGGFENNGSQILALEEDLMRHAGLLVVSSAWLDEEGAKYNQSRALIRNAGQYEHFSQPPAEVFQDPSGRRVIGYYGAIAAWFDCALVEAVARDNPDCLVLLVGGDTCKAREQLRDCPNVEFTGEVPYDRLPYYLYGFDLCLLPFQVIPLTLATNPVKAYEYLSAGKPIVTVDLPEMRQFGDLIMVSEDRAAFLENVRHALAEPVDAPVRQRRQRYASEQTWAHRVHTLCEAVDTCGEPIVSVVVLTYNNLDLTKACLSSLEIHSDYPNLEIIVVDNASADGTPAYLQQWAEGWDNRKIILNSDNRGFAAGNNQGLAVARGDFLVMLNNDTYVTPGWVRTMANHLRIDPGIGIVGPVTNNIGNEARIETNYTSMDDMLVQAAAYTRGHAGQALAIRTTALFCAMIPRAIYEQVGGLDEAFGVGFFEDDDYCRRIAQAGLRVVCAEDVFVHHQLSASFDKLKAEQRKALFDRNKAIYEGKWGEWIPHRYRGKVDA